MVKYPVPEGNIWLNSSPLKKDDLLGKVVLFDFWTYSCVNCLRTLPHLKRWWEKYRDKNFLIVGIHTPEFEFEKEPQNVAHALRAFGITWPVVLDNDYRNWKNFANRYWPAKYLTEGKGNIIYSHFGEGDYELTEIKIREAIGQNLGSGELSPLEAAASTLDRVSCIEPTPELYCGYKRGRFANVGEYQYDGAVDYNPPEAMPPNSIALEGKFIVRPECAEALEHGAKIWLNFQATEVNLVMAPVSWGAVLDLELDGSLLDGTVMGTDVNPASKVAIYRPAMYNLIKSPMPVKGILRVAVFEWSPPFRAYAFTFSGCLG